MAAVEARLEDYLAHARRADRLLEDGEPLREGGLLRARAARELFEDQCASRQLDTAARELKRQGHGFYTIGSAGHENNVALGALLERTDPCFLHYRSGALMLARARKLPGSTPIFDALLSLCASSQDPCSGGRHKVFGSRPLWVPPQTSTIASHVPKAVGMALGIGRARRLGQTGEIPANAIVCVSFGDASLNHATALAGFNLARYAARQGAPVPVLFVCEDNGIGISTPTPAGWIEANFARMPWLDYVRATGDLASVFQAVGEAIRRCRTARRPVFLHLDCVRLFGHAGSDVETTYRTLAEIDAVESGDPLLANARFLVETGAAEPAQLRQIVDLLRERVGAASREAAARPRLHTRAEIVAPLGRLERSELAAFVAEPCDLAARAKHFQTLPEQVQSATKRTLGALLNAALHDEMLRRPTLCLFGEDVAKKGGVYGITQDLQKRFGVARVFDTLLDETSILGLAQGFAQAGLLPMPEIQYLAYIHNALDQLRSEACSLSYFSNGQFTNPMVVRVAGLAYQKGFGGHFHNDNSIGALRDIPGLLLCVPSRGDDAVRLLRGAVACALSQQRVVVFLEPIALYHERDLYQEGDQGWLCDYPPPGGASSALLPGDVGLFGPDDAELLIVSYGNGVRLSHRAARELEQRHGRRARVLDLRWINPLPAGAVLEHAEHAGAVLVADECRHTGGGVADAVIAALAEAGYRGRLGSVRAADTYVPLGGATAAVLIQDADIVAAALGLLA